MIVMKFLITILLLICSIIFILGVLINNALKKKGLNLLFSASGLFSLKYLKINIDNRYLHNYNISDLEILVTDVSLKIRSWKLKLVLSSCKLKFYINNNNDFGNHIGVNVKNIRNRKSSNYFEDKNDTINNDIGIIRNLVLIVIIQIISRTFQIEFHNIEFISMLTDCSCNDQQKISDNICKRCERSIRYGLVLKLVINSLFMSAKTHIGGVMFNLKLNNAYFIVYPTENTISYKRCYADYMNSKGEIDYNEVKSNDSVLKYIVNQFKSSICDDIANTSFGFPPLLYIKDELNVDIKLIHSIYGSNINIFKIENLNIRTSRLWLTLVVEVICELIYIYHIYIKNNRNRTKTHKREENSMNINDFSSYTQITNSNRFDVNNNNYNYNFIEQIKVNCNIQNPVIIFCDNTKTSSGFELIFDEFESNLMIQYYKEYFVKNEITGVYSDIFDDDSSGEFENLSCNELDFKKKRSKYGTESEKLERIIKNFKLLSLSRMVTGNSIIYSNSDKNSGFSVFTKTSDLNEIKDGHIIFDRMFIVDRYKSLFESSSNNSIKLYFRNSIQKVFGFWKENGFYQNLSLFLQLIRFRKYLLKIDNGNSSTCIDNYRVEFTNEILNIPPRTELDESDIINSYFTIENNGKLLEIKNNPNINTNLLFYFDIKDLIIQTRNISLSNNELFDLKNKYDTTNNHCERCFIDSFGPNERYDWRIIVENCCDYNLNNDNRYFTLIIKHLKLCNTSLNRNFSMLFKDLKLFSMKDFVDLEDISFNYLIRSGEINDKHDSDTTCIHKYGCFNQQIKSFKYQKVDYIKESKLFLVKGKEVLINIPWDYKKISLRVSKVDGDLSLSYIPIYLYLLSCFTVDSISLKNSSLHKIYYGVNNKFEENIDYYIEKRTNYYNEFSILKSKLTNLVTDISPLEVLNRNIENWTIPDIIISKSGKKYTWYFNFEDINVNFYNNFKLIIKYLSLYRCNEYGNYDIVINNMEVIDSKSNNIINSNKIRLRSDIPFKSIKIESPICLKKQLRRLLDLSINGDLLLLHILGDQNNVKNNLENINNGLIYFDSKRFILEIDCLKMLILNNIHYMESLFEYIYKYVYISYYQLFHPPITIRLGKLLSYSRKHPIVFSCNNIFDFNIRNCSIHFYELNNILLNNKNKNAVSIQNNCILFSKDDSYIHSFKVSSDNDVSPSEDMNWKRIIDVNNEFNVPIIDINFDLLRIHIRTKHISNVKSNCDDKECYNLPNYLLYKFDNSKLLINPDYNPFNIFGYTHNFALNMHNSVNNIYNNVIYSRNELIMDIKCLFFDVRRIYNNINRTIEGNKIINSDLSVSIYSNNKLEVKISNINSYESYKKLLPLMEIIKRGSRFKYRNNKRSEYCNNSINTFIDQKVVKILVNVANKMKISISPYTKGSNGKNRYIYDNQSIDIILGKIDYLLNIEYSDKSDIKQIKGALNIQDGLNINLNSVIFNDIYSKFDKKYSIIHNIVNTSKLALKYNYHVNSEINIDLFLNGIEKDLYTNRNLKTKMHMSNNILTVNINNEKANTITQIMELFFDYDNFHNIKMYYCVTCMEYKYKNEMKQVKKRENRIMDILFGKLNYKLNATLSDIHIKYEFFGLIINKAMLNIQNSNNHHHVTRKFKFNINDVFLFVEAYPLKYNTSILINEAKQSGNTVNNIKLISSFNSKTKIINFLHIGKALFNINLIKNTKEDDDIIVIDSIRLSLNMLLLIYFEAFLKIIKYNNNNCSNSSNSNNLNIQILNNLKLSVQVNNLFVNTYIINSRDIHSRQTNNNIDENCNNLNLKLNMNDIDDLLSTILNKNPIYNTIKVVDEHNNCNETMKIFNIDKMDCIECKYRVNGILLYSSYIKIDHCKNNSIYINNYVRKYTNNRNKSTFSIYNEYKKINIYNETHNNNLVEYGIFMEGLFDVNNSNNHSYHNYHYDQENSMNTFKQVILNVNNIDLILLFKENNKLELLLKMLPLSIHIAISNNLLWNLSEHEIRNSDNKIHLTEYNEDYYLNNISNKNMEEKSTEYYLDNKNEFIVGETDEYEDKLIINDFYENENNDNTYELLKTTPIFINFFMNVLKYNQNIRMYCNSLFLSIDSNRVQIINEILNSFDYRTTLLKQSNVSVISNCNNSNLLSSIASSNVTFSNNNLTPVAFSNLNGINNTSLPPSIYYSNNNSSNTVIHHDNTNCYNIGNTNNNLDNNSDIYYLNNNTHSTFRTPSSISFSSYFNENMKTNNSINNDDICNNYNDFNNCNNNNNYHRLSILNMLSIDFEKQNDNISKHNKRMSINNNKSQNIEDLNNKNINNILKYEIDKYLMDNPLSYTMIDNIQNQQSFDGDNMQVINNNIQVEFIIDKLNIDMFIDGRMFSNFRSTEINIVLLSNKQKDKSTIIEFDASSINLVANKDFFYNEGHNSMQNNCNVNTNSHNNNINNDNVSVEEKVPIICPMYIDGHTSQGHGHVLSVRINMRQIKLLELFNIRILESVIIRVNPIKVNITQYLTSCYYDIFFKTQTNVTNTNIALNNISNTNVNNPNNNNNNGCNSEFYTDNNNYVSNCNVGNNYDNIYIETNNNSDNNDNGTNFNNANSNNGNYNINHVLIGDINNGSISLFMNNDIAEKKILYFNYLRISSILAEVTYRGSVSLNKVLFELSSFTQRRKCRTFKGMIDKYLSFLRRQAARPVISYTFKQIKQSLLPKHFKSLKRNSNYNTHYNYLYNDNQSGYSSSNIHSFSMNYNASQNDLIDLNYGNESNSKYEKYYNNNYNDLYNNNNNSSSSNNTHNNDNKNITSIHNNTNPRNSNLNRSNLNSNSRVDSEYSKFRLLFGNQLLF